MKVLVPYLTFSGNCEEALNFYKNAFGGEIVSLQKFGDSPMEIPAEAKNNVMHSEFKSDGIYFMASDSMPGQPTTVGTNISMSVVLENEQEQDAVFNKLAEGGKITMPLQDTFWGARFGMLQDKYGINWMFNQDKVK